ncbi:MAG: hypothetical protein SFU91_07880 [Chloroherpetonaceae bacterium]|nr:hypothetical protein [Chloroherpetonaceae bacterium]
MASYSFSFLQQLVFREAKGWVLLWLTISLVLFGVMVFKEWRTRLNPRFPLRLLASFIASVMIFLLGSGAGFESKTNSRSTVLLILPEGSSDSQKVMLDEALRFADSLGANQRAVLIRSQNFDDGSENEILPGNFRQVHRIEEVLRQLNLTDSLFLFGNGLLNNELPLLEPFSFVHVHPFIRNSGFVITSPQAIIQSELSTLCGYWQSARLQNDADLPDLITIEHPGGKRDSIFNPNGNDRFVFRSFLQIPVSGYYSFFLQAFRSNTLIGSETLHVEVKAPRKLRVLMLYQTPTFELTTLKNHLASLGHEIYEHVKFSKARTRTESINPSTGKKLEQYGDFAAWDVLITDPAFLSFLSPNSLRALQSAISNQGLGLMLYSTSARVLQTQSLQFITSLQLPFKEVSGDKEFKRDLYFVNLLGEPEAATLPEPALNFLKRNPSYSQQVLASIDNGGGSKRPVAIFESFGKGSIISLASLETNIWLRSGNGRIYNMFWATLFRSLIPKPSVSLNSITPFATESFPFDFSLSYSEAPSKIPKALFTSIDGSIRDTIYFRQSIFNPTEFHATLYPTQKGWHRIVPLTDSLIPIQTTLVEKAQSEPLEFDFFVYPQQNWEIANSIMNINSTISSLIIWRNQSKSFNTSSKSLDSNMLDQPFNLVQWKSLQLLQAFLLLLSLSYLWLEDKLRS